MYYICINISYIYTQYMQCLYVYVISIWIIWVVVKVLWFSMSSILLVPHFCGKKSWVAAASHHGHVSNHWMNIQLGPCNVHKY